MTNPWTQSQFKMKYPFIQKSVFPPVFLFLRDLESLGKNSLAGTLFSEQHLVLGVAEHCSGKPVRRYLSQENLYLAVLRHLCVSAFPKATRLALCKLDWKIRFLPVPCRTGSPIVLPPPSCTSSFLGTWQSLVSLPLAPDPGMC